MLLIIPQLLGPGGRLLIKLSRKCCSIAATDGNRNQGILVKTMQDLAIEQIPCQ
jgi:hypothetical protein